MELDGHWRWPPPILLIQLTDASIDGRRFSRSAAHDAFLSDSLARVTYCATPARACKHRDL